MSLWLCTHCSYGPISITHKGLTSSQALGYQRKKKREREEMKNRRKRRKKNKSTKTTEKKKKNWNISRNVHRVVVNTYIDRRTSKRTTTVIFFLFFFSFFFLQLHFSLGVNELTSRISNNASLISLISDRSTKVSVFVFPMKNVCSFCHDFRRKNKGQRSLMDRRSAAIG